MWETGQKLPSRYSQKGETTRVPPPDEWINMSRRSIYRILFRRERSEALVHLQCEWTLKTLC